MKSGSLLLALLTGAIAACQPDLPFTGDDERRAETPAAAPAAADTAARGEARADPELVALARPPRGQETVCQTFARKVAESAVDHGNDPLAFMAALEEEFVGGDDNPFDLKRGLREGSWNQRYFYAGHGGFRPEYDDAQRYPDGGNHQPGHFVSVLSLATRFGEEQARIGIAYAGDYDPGDEDDLRLSMVAIPLGAGLGAGTVTPADVAQRVRALCR